MTLKFKKGEGKGNQDGGYDKRKNYFMNIIVRAYNGKELLSAIIFWK